MTVLGTDISSNQHPPQHLDFAAAKGVGIEFVIVKATQGATYRNPYFAQDVAAARAAGMAIGAYHWVSPTTSAAAQAANFLATIAGHITAADLPCGLDFEEKGAKHTVLDDIRGRIHAAALRTMTYTYSDFWKHYGSTTCPACAADPLWWASPSRTMRPPPRPWTSVAIWQYAGTSVPIAGIGEKEDANQALVPLADLIGTPPVQEDDDMATFLARSKGDGRWYVWSTAGTKNWVPTKELAGVYVLGGTKAQANAQPFVWSAPFDPLPSAQDITPGTKPNPAPVKE